MIRGQFSPVCIRVLTGDLGSVLLLCTQALLQYIEI